MVQPMLIPFRHFLVKDLDRGFVLLQDGGKRQTNPLHSHWSFADITQDFANHDHEGRRKKRNRESHDLKLVALVPQWKQSERKQ